LNAKDVVMGGDGGDTYIYHYGATIIEQAGDFGIDYVTWNSPGFLTYTLPANVEGFYFTDEGKGAITGNELENNLYGGKYTDNLYSGAGEDKLDGREGDDRMVGGEGDDWYEVDSYNDVVVEEHGQGTDTLSSTLASQAAWQRA
jgi:Ca2+-binding RTX toxin-like protein